MTLPPPALPFIPLPMASLDSETAASGGVKFLGNRRAYWRLLMRGAGLLMVTLGIYRFWLATDVRRFLWSHTQVDGQTLEYTGTPLELLLGFLIAVAILIPVYAAFFFIALDLGSIGQMSGLIGFALLFVLGQYAVYRARRYRLTRTIFRGLRFHQTGATWKYALRASLWWTATGLTLGLAYPFQIANLERYKMRNTFYGDLAGRFHGSGWSLFLRGLPMWIAVMAPLAVTIGAFIEVVDWQALANAIELDGDDVMSRIESGNPALAGVFVFAMLMGGTAVGMAALLYPAFQAMMLRWWSSGLRFGDIEMRSSLRTRQVYGAYMRFLWFAILFCIALAIIGVPALLAAGSLAGNEQASAGSEIVATGILLVGYVIAALGFSTVYRATVQLSLWQLGMESLQLSGLSALGRVKATGQASSAVGEGLADALNVGGY
ncbi:MAG: DUF898 family protein [Pseudolabrys sp.]|nr:DUF898 family protein [Pseudolabrys sp.]